MRSSERWAARVWVVVALGGLLGVAGCGPGGPKTYPVKGRVELAAGEVKQLAGSHVEAALVSDPTVRASGEVGPDGTFTLQTLHAGAVRKGAREGTYQVRIILPDEDRPARQRAAQTVAPRFLAFATSGLSLQVPSNGEVVFKVGPR